VCDGLAFQLQCKNCKKGNFMVCITVVPKLIFLFCLFIQPLFAETLEFGRVRVGDFQRDSIQIKNENLVNLMIAKTTFSDTIFALPASPLTGAMTILGPGVNRALPIVFSPRDFGVVSGKLTVETNLGDFLWDLTGEGVQEVVVINEVLADPASGLAGDANGDGVRDSNQDEFIEFLNTGKYPINMGGWKTFDAGASAANRLTFPSPTWIGPNQRVLVFGGGNPTGLSVQFFVDDGRIGGGLRNSGDEIFLFDPVMNDTLAHMVYDSKGNKNQSLVRWPEGLGPWQLHGEFPGNGAAFSPGSPRIVANRLIFLPSDTTVSVGDTLTFVGSIKFTDGTDTDVNSKDLAWTVSDETILKQQDETRWTALSPGRVQLLACLQDLLYDTLSVGVEAPGIGRLDVSVGDSVFLVGDTVSIAVTGIISDNDSVFLSAGYQVVVSDSTILSTTGNSIEARAPGRTQVSVTYNGLSAGLPIWVWALGDLDGDGAHTLWDVIRTVHLILGIPPEAQLLERRSADLTRDNVLDIRDLIAGIQLMLGGSVVSSKPVDSDRQIGWVGVGKGISLSLPHQTVAITFEILGEQLDLEIQATYGHISVRSGQRGIEGVVLALGDDGMDVVNGAVEIYGLRNFSDSKWTAWTLDGAGHPLIPLDQLSDSLAVLSASPNPLNPETVVSYAVPFRQNITLGVYSVTGQWIRELFAGQVSTGTHNLVWDGRDAWGRLVGSGLYFVHLQGEKHRSTLKMIVLR